MDVGDDKISGPGILPPLKAPVHPVLMSKGENVLNQQAPHNEYVEQFLQNNCCVWNYLIDTASEYLTERSTVLFEGSYLGNSDISLSLKINSGGTCVGHE